MEIENSYHNEIYKTIKQLFALDEKDIMILNLLISSKFPELCIKEIKKLNELPERTIQRRLNQLVKKGLILRRPISISEFIETCIKHKMNSEINHDIAPHNLENAKGYIFLYKLTPKEKLKELFFKILENWK